MSKVRGPGVEASVSTYAKGQTSRDQPGIKASKEAPVYLAPLFPLFPFFHTRSTVPMLIHNYYFSNSAWVTAIVAIIIGSHLCA